MNESKSDISYSRDVLAQNQPLLLSILEETSDAIYLKDTSGRYLYFNAAAIRFAGKSGEAVLGKSDSEIFPSNQAREMMVRDREVLNSGRTQTYEEMLTTNVGIITFLSTKGAVRNANGEIVGIFGISKDITAQKRAEEVDRFLAQAGANSVAGDFFPALARFLSETLQMDFVCIDQLDDDGANATTLTVWMDGQFRDNFSYALSGTPCGTVLEHGSCCYPNHVSRLFPSNIPLNEMQAESYVGISLSSRDGKPIGLIVAISRQELTNKSLAEATLDKVAKRASFELERLQAEQKIAHATDMLERTGEMAKIGGWSLNLKSMKLTWTTETFRITKTPSTLEPTVDRMISSFAPAARETIRLSLQSAIEEGQPFDLELPMHFVNQRNCWVHIQGFAQLRESTSIRIYGTIQDITERRQIQQSLIANEARFRAIIDASPVPMAINDQELRITFLNPAFVQTFGYDLADIPTISDWWPKAYPDPAYQKWVVETWQTELARATKSKTEFSPIEVKIRCKDGTDRYVLVSATPLEADLKQTHLVLLYDISERKRAEQNLKAAHELASRAKNEFLANMSHEIRTPLTAILGFADILGEEAGAELTQAKRKQIVETIKNAGSHLLTVINDILDLSKIEAGKLTVEKVETEIVHILSEVERLLLHSASAKGLSLQFEIASDLPERILSDATRIRQILLNLVGNAIKFTSVGSVKISAVVDWHASQPQLVIDIRDTGAGMSLEQAEGIFKAFSQTDSTVTRRHGGTGLGLVISRRLAQMMDGDVILLHSELGKGSCFRLVLPFEKAEGAVEERERPYAYAKVGLDSKPISTVEKLAGRILLAEDGVDNQRLIVHLIQKAGATIETAENGRIALEMLENAELAAEPFDMLLTDMQMPEMDGYTLVRILRSRGSRLPIVALTAHAMEHDRKKCIDVGCNDYLPKPINRSNLIATCAKWIGSNLATKNT